MFGVQTFAANIFARTGSASKEQAKARRTGDAGGMVMRIF